MNQNWKYFWENYRRIQVNGVEDLFVEVGKTINGQPVSINTIDSTIRDIAENLELEKTDIVMELCCGNGLVTLPLSYLVSRVYAFDFTEHLIDSAKKFRFRDNIEYFISDANSNFFDALSFTSVPAKFLMSDSLSYFDFNELKNIVAKIIDHSTEFKFYITGIPNEKLKWNFYDTEERKMNYIKMKNSGYFSANGIGNWWNLDDICSIANYYNIDCKIIDCDENISNYRSNILLSK